MRRRAGARVARAACGCKQRETQISLKFLDVDAARRAARAQQQTSLKCVNYLEFTGGDGRFSSQCTRVEVALDDLCDLAKVAEGQELFKLSPETPLPITIEGMRVFPATSCNSSSDCPPRRIFSGTTVRNGQIGDYAGQVLEMPVKVIEPCGLPEAVLLPARRRHLRGGVRRRRRSCATASRAAACARGCRGPDRPDMDCGQGGIDSGQ